jgi:hypothetical protein
MTDHRSCFASYGEQLLYVAIGQPVMLGAERHSLRAATPPPGGVNAPNDVKHGKTGTETVPVGEAFLGGCPGRL